MYHLIMEEATQLGVVVVNRLANHMDNSKWPKARILGSSTCLSWEPTFHCNQISEDNNVADVSHCFSIFSKVLQKISFVASEHLIWFVFKIGRD